MKAHDVIGGGVGHLAEAGCGLHLMEKSERGARQAFLQARVQNMNAAPYPF
jgi:hypothetical protein